jgi:hypothetical protein
VVPGLYDVRTGADQNEQFTVTGTDLYNEVLGTRGVPKIRVQIATGDQIQISGPSEVFFTPVSTPFVRTYSALDLYTGSWTVGQDLGPGKYVATPATGQVGQFVVKAEGVAVTLGGDSSQGEVPSVTFTVHTGDVIEISGLGQVSVTPTS